MPSSRSFLLKLNPAAAVLRPGEMHGTIINYEHMPRFTHRATKFEKNTKTGRIEPVGGDSSADDGMVSRETATAFMEDLADTAGKAEFISELKKRREVWKALEQTRRRGKDEIVKTLRQKLADSPTNHHAANAVVRDYIEYLQTNRQGEVGANISLDNVGLEPVASHVHISKWQLAEKYPQWAPILNDPAIQISNLVSAGDMATLGPLMDAVHDADISVIFANLMAKKKPTDGERKLILSMIDGEKPAFLAKVIETVLATPHYANETEILAKAIEKGDYSGVISVLQELQSNKTHYHGGLIWSAIEKLMMSVGGSFSDYSVRHVINSALVKALSDERLKKVASPLDNKKFYKEFVGRLHGPYSYFFSEFAQSLVDKLNPTTPEGKGFVELVPILKKQMERVHSDGPGKFFEDLRNNEAAAAYFLTLRARSGKKEDNALLDHFTASGGRLPMVAVNHLIDRYGNYLGFSEEERARLKELLFNYLRRENLPEDHLVAVAKSLERLDVEMRGPELLAQLLIIDQTRKLPREAWLAIGEVLDNPKKPRARTLKNWEAVGRELAKQGLSREERSRLEAQLRKRLAHLGSELPVSHAATDVCVKDYAGLP